MPLPLDPSEIIETRPVRLLRSFVSQFAPWLSLGVGILARVLNEHDITFAPKAVALIIVAWTLPVLVAKVLPAYAEGAVEPKWRRATRTTGAPFVIVVLYKNVLFFLVPIWFGAAHFPSLNMGVPILLAAMALLTCFTKHYDLWVTRHPLRRVLWSAVVLFAALVPAVAVSASTSPRMSLFVSALLATSVATASLRTGETILSRRALIGVLSGALPVAGLVVLAAPLLPPVPAICHAKGAGTGIVNRNLVGQANSFARGTRKVYAWFSVTLPAHYRQRVAFKWFHDGTQVGASIVTTLQGGRSEGYRAATHQLSPGPGRWRADLYTDSAQLIERVSFDVGP